MNTIRAPWTLGTHDPRVVYNVHGNEVVTVHGHHDDTVSVARLIAAAPDLLAACEAARQWLGPMAKSTEWSDYYSTLIALQLKLDAAIAAAKGEA